MIIKRFPHEFLARWGRGGELRGYHIVPVDIACDDMGVPIKKNPENPSSENLLEKFGEATSLDRAGVDLSSVLGEIHLGALKSLDAARQELSASSGEIARLTKLLEEAEQELARLR